MPFDKRTSFRVVIGDQLFGWPGLLAVDETGPAIERHLNFTQAKKGCQAEARQP
jgi:hypothetical protein